MAIKKCADCQRKGSLHSFRREGKILYLCARCIDQLVWDWVSRNPSKAPEPTTKSLEGLLKF